MEVNRITTRDIDDFYGQLLTEGMTQANLAHHHRILRAALNRGRKWKLLVENPADDVDVDTVARHELTTPSPEQVLALAQRAQSGGSPDQDPS